MSQPGVADAKPVDDHSRVRVARERRSRSFLYNGNVVPVPVVFFLYTPIVNCNFPWKSFGYKADSLASCVHACKQ